MCLCSQKNNWTGDGCDTTFTDLDEDNFGASFDIGKGGDYAYYQDDATAGHLEGYSLLFGLLFWSAFIGPPIADVIFVRVNLRFFTKNENDRHYHTKLYRTLSQRLHL